MKILFYNTKDSASEAKLVLQDLKKLGVLVVDAGENTMAIAAKNDSAIGQIDAIVVLGKKLDTQAGYLIALGLSQSKNILYLLPEGSELDPAISNLPQDKNMASRLVISFFNNTNLSNNISNFLESLDASSLTEYFNIKYTLRVSRKISDYLNWKAQADQTKKADWIRDFIKDLMEKDLEYQKYLKNRFRSK